MYVYLMWLKYLSNIYTDLFAKPEAIYVIIHIMYFNQVHKEGFNNATYKADLTYTTI